MFIIQTDKFSLAFAHKCGSRTICDYIGGAKHNDLLENSFIQNSHLSFYFKTLPKDIVRIVVLREPKDRFLAAWQVSTALKRRFKQDFDHNIYIHGTPYIHEIEKSLNFYVIPFSNLSNYFKQDLGGEEKKYGPRIWSKEYDKLYDWEKEVAAYNYFLTNREIITPEKLESLIKTSNYINIKNTRYTNLRYKKININFNPYKNTIIE